MKPRLLDTPVTPRQHAFMASDDRHWGVRAKEVRRTGIRHVVMDMDGVLYRGDHPLPGAVDTLNTLRARGVRVAFLTNNASRHREELAARLSRLGFECTAGDVWGSAYIAARYLSRHAPEARVFLVGTAGMRREMEEAGLAVAPTHEGATHVVAGLDMTVTYEKLSNAHYAICNGATFIATNLDATFPTAPPRPPPAAAPWWRHSRRLPASHRSSWESRNRPACR